MIGVSNKKKELRYDIQYQCLPTKGRYLNVPYFLKGYFGGNRC
jgi:hypothetical protein